MKNLESRIIELEEEVRRHKEIINLQIQYNLRDLEWQKDIVEEIKKLQNKI